MLLGNVNVSKFGTRFAGVGGFVNISQSARRLVFCGTFTSGNAEYRVENGRLDVLREGTVKKFVKEVEQCCFNAAGAEGRGQKVLYITERAVFEIGETGLELKEVAPGCDLEQDILAHMDFRPIVRDVQPMPAHVFV